MSHTATLSKTSTSDCNSVQSTAARLDEWCRKKKQKHAFFITPGREIGTPGRNGQVHPISLLDVMDRVNTCLYSFIKFP